MFEKRGPDATLEICEAECYRLDACVGFSIIVDEWCIACATGLSEPHIGAVGFKKGGKYSNFETRFHKGSINLSSIL